MTLNRQTKVLLCLSLAMAGLSLLLLFGVRFSSIDLHHLEITEKLSPFSFEHVASTSKLLPARKGKSKNDLQIRSMANENVVAILKKFKASGIKNEQLSLLNELLTAVREAEWTSDYEIKLAEDDAAIKANAIISANNAAYIDLIRNMHEHALWDQFVKAGGLALMFGSFVFSAMTYLINRRKLRMDVEKHPHELAKLTQDRDGEIVPVGEAENRPSIH